MKPQKCLALLALTIGLVAGAFTAGALAAEFKNVGDAPAILYDAPSNRGEKLFIAPRGMPVEAVLNYGAWTKVRDLAGDLSWIETKQLAERKNILVRSINAKIHASADDSSNVVFSADKGVLLELIESNTSGWLKVKHKDGLVGYIRQSDVWGI